MKIIIKSILFLVLFISCSDNDDNLIRGNPEEMITKNSPLVELMEKMTREDTGNPTESITCVRFVYPMTIYLYDEEYFQTGKNIFYNRVQLSDFLGNLPEDQLISISYPLEITLLDGSILSISNNNALKASIDSCAKEDIINYCNGLFGSQNQQNSTCYWFNGYQVDFYNKYAGSFFFIDSNNNVKIKFYDTELIGNLVFLYLVDDLYLNINIESQTPFSADWNYNFKVDYISSNEMIISQNDIKRYLYRKCEDIEPYAIGDIGPTGGLVAYDKGNYSDGWRYIEVNLSDLDQNEWGCVTGDVTFTQALSIGTGLLNSSYIVYFHDNLENYYTNPIICSALNNGSLTSKEALTLELNDKKDWFIPSLNELQVIYSNLNPINLGNFSNQIYWS